MTTGKLPVVTIAILLSFLLFFSPHSRHLLHKDEETQNTRKSNLCPPCIQILVGHYRLDNALYQHADQ